jgi:hypothetical protein
MRQSTIPLFPSVKMRESVLSNVCMIALCEKGDNWTKEQNSTAMSLSERFITFVKQM